MRLILLLICLLFTFQDYPKEKNEAVLYLLKDEGFKDSGSKDVMDYLVDLSFFETEPGLKSKLPELYFITVSKRVSIDTPPKKLINTKALKEIYKKHYDFFGKDNYWIDEHGNRISFDLNNMYRKIYIIEEINYVLYKTEVKQADIIID